MFRPKPDILEYTKLMNSETKIALGALAISLFALAASGFQSVLQYKHNRISVIPKLDWRISFNELDYLFELKLINVGLGPAIIENLNIVFEDELRSTDTLNACLDLDAFLDSTGKDQEVNFCWTMANDEQVFLRSGEELIIYRVGHDDISDRKWIAPKQAQSVGLYANYCSLYNQCYLLE